LEHLLDGSDGPAERRHVVVEQLAEPATLEEVALQVDDQERRFRGLEGEFVRVRVERQAPGSWRA
jgi:hypothetical protein